MSGAGKSTLGLMLLKELSERSLHAELLDGDEVRQNLSEELGYDRDGRDRNVRRIGYVAHMLERAGAASIVAAMSPYRAARREVRLKVETFIEVFCECPVEVLKSRDPKRLYARALAGEIRDLSGIDAPYEAPDSPEVHLRTDLTNPSECTARILSHLEERGILSRTEGP